MNISYFLIKQMIEDKNIRELAFLIKLKSLYVSGCVHNYSPFKLSKDSGISRNSVKKYVDFYLKNGYARIECDNLIFTKFTKIEGKYKHGTIFISAELSIKKIIALLHKEILCDKVRKFTYLQRTKKDSINPMGKGTLNKLKKAKKSLRNLGTDASKLPNALAKYTVSIKTIAKHLNCSVGKAQGIINTLCEGNLIKRITNYTILAQDSFSKKMNKNFKRELLSNNQGSWSTGSMIFKRKTNSYVF